MSADAALARVRAALTRRGIPIPADRPAPVPIGQYAHRGEPGEPGDPAWHHEQRVALALDRWAAVTPPRYRNACAEHPGVIAWADQVIADPTTAPSLLLWGGTGTGKTHQAFGAARRIAEAGLLRYGLTFVTHPEMYAQLRPPIPEEERHRFKSRLLRTPLLLLDDLGTAKESGWTEEVLHQVLNSRYNTQLPTIITSNYSPRQLRGVLDDRIHSRLAEMTIPIQMTGPDRRIPR